MHIDSPAGAHVRSAYRCVLLCAYVRICLFVRLVNPTASKLLGKIRKFACGFCLDSFYIYIYIYIYTNTYIYTYPYVYIYI